ncbi:DUF6197 family protein [Actinocatenispora rupis]|uniref:Uncharacterized protein n=1 Tax=Actinocatenispora rupis TaxID=519421 RepID=A0A8J3J6T2_9ACTN|nr:hypothetical protein [Actinocatenispora rupis]GID13075.1 hypothetical protein Aru02nite_39640 [Actinocatenispora rupis]
MDCQSEAAQVLRDAATYIDTHGWYRGNYFPAAEDPVDWFPPACALGAIGMALAGNAAAAGYRMSYGEDNAVIEFARFLCPEAWQQGYGVDEIVGAWNDEQAIDAADVAATLRAAADQLAPAIAAQQ